MFLVDRDNELRGRYIFLLAFQGSEECQLKLMILDMWMCISCYFYFLRELLTVFKILFCFWVDIFVDIFLGNR